MSNVPAAVFPRVPSVLHDKPCADEHLLVRADESIRDKYPEMRGFRDMLACI
ncbi:hypothetical protein [Paenibacillus jiagnxiensis]|uniref:hypothetical protein n=1 Tax=Paenibacillus jiagnxiensis TaxID=3228926 RepID=UPI0033A93909